MAQKEKEDNFIESTTDTVLIITLEQNNQSGVLIHFKSLQTLPNIS